MSKITIDPKVLKRLEKLNIASAESIEKQLSKADSGVYLDPNLIAIFRFTTEHTLYVENE